MFAKDVNKIFEYQFNLPNGEVYIYPIVVNKFGQIILKEPIADDVKDVVKLENCRCSNCPLSNSDYPNCPAAEAVLDIVSHFKDLDSFQMCHVEVTENRRKISADVDIQSGLRSLLGLVLPLTACPHFRFLRQMALRHLPFSSSHETLVRVIGFYLLGEYLETPEKVAHLEKLERQYNELNAVNQGLIDRISSYESKDAGRNAIVVLDSFLQAFNCEVEFDFDEIKKHLKI